MTVRLFNNEVQLFQSLAKAKPQLQLRVKDGFVWQAMQVIASFSSTEAAVNTLYAAGYVLKNPETPETLYLVVENKVDKLG